MRQELSRLGAQRAVHQVRARATRSAEAGGLPFLRLRPPGLPPLGLPPLGLRLLGLPLPGLRLLGLLVLGIPQLGLVVSCAPVTAVVSHPGPPFRENHPSQVRIYLDEEQAPPGFRELGFIVANTHVFVPVMFNLDAMIAQSLQTVPPGNQAQHPVLWALVRKAAAMGADGVVITGFTHAGTLLSISGVAIRSGGVE